MNDNTWVLLAVAALNAWTAYFSWKAHANTLVTRQTVSDTQKDIHTIEKATNSMKDQLVKASGLAGETRGRAEGDAEIKDLTAQLAKKPPTGENP
jgi:hypothetical protein